MIASDPDSAHDLHHRPGLRCTSKFDFLEIIPDKQTDTYMIVRSYYILNIIENDSLGPEYGEGRILNLEATWEESEPRTPLICTLSIGSDPSAQIASLAKSKEIQLKAVSMGQGQEIVARK
ncbi:Dynein heavy chain 5, axonemal [Eumeta japonica]|uniref:Dynein heavy chain 5, axonemal n=1 Tax=Eumeta variegata TaxID=151549 RepID=A0A4C2A5R0_EUMVA|nr:Dynein heavy chain 5, axonemal [Eumeta japonica]